eukprot:8879664-Pyramimonas_sp.AAC.1
MTVKARVSGVSTLCWHASPSTMYTHYTAAEAYGGLRGSERGSGGVVIGNANRGLEGIYRSSLDA